MLSEIVERRVDGRPLALMRILVGAASLVIAVEVAGVLVGATRPGAVTLPVFTGLAPVSSSFVMGFFALWLVAAVMLAIGYNARASATLVATCGVAALLLEQQTYSNHLVLMIALCALLALGQSGAAWSIDARREGHRRDVPFWPVALIMLQITTVYAFTALSKLNPSFLSGETMLDASQSYFSLSLSDLTPWMVSLLAASAVCAEAFLAVALWRPKLRPFAFSVGLMLHAGILVLLAPTQHLVPFALLALSTYILFLQPASRVVVWDDTCRSCRRWVSLFSRLDWLDANEFVAAGELAAHPALGVTREQADRGLQVVTDGVRYEGYDAVRVVLEACPATFLVAPILRLPPLRILGTRAYAKVAEARTAAVQPA